MQSGDISKVIPPDSWIGGSRMDDKLKKGEKKSAHGIRRFRNKYSNRFQKIPEDSEKFQKIPDDFGRL